MKKALYGTTMLVAAGLVAGTAQAAEKIKIGVGGYYQEVFAITDEDADTNAVNVVQEGEIHFKGSTTLDNGLTVGVEVQLEGYTTGDQIDEHYVFLDGSWGRFLIGAENSAPYLMAYGSPSAITGHGVTSPNFQHITGVANRNTAHSLNLVSDANKVTYFTPRFSGFQFGISYTPDTGTGQTCPNTSLRNGYSSSYGFPTDDNCAPEEIVSAAANYVQDFGTFNLAASAGMEYAFDGGLVDDDIFDWQLGLQAGVSGFTIGGGYINRSDNRGWSAVVGATYGTGPWTVGAGFGYFEDINDDNFYRIEGGGKYALGPGVDLAAGVFYYNDDDASNQDSITGALTLGLSF